jgi:hypothetical protein
MNEESKLILSAYRPSGKDADDPAFSEALAVASSDAALGQWLADQQAFDREVARKLAEVSAPAGLRERILAGGEGEPATTMVAPATALDGCCRLGAARMFDPVDPVASEIRYR